MIMKPIQANPHVFTHLRTDERSLIPMLHTLDGFKVPSNTAFFTAKETAEIAKAYLAAYLKEKRALLRPDSEHKKAAANLREWRRKFKEWSK